MLVESKNINKSKLTKLVSQSFGLDITSIKFNPIGEDSYSYILKNEDSKKYFVKIYSRITEKEIEKLHTKNEVVNALRQQAGIKSITYPLKAINGEVVCRYEDLYFSLFSFINGKAKNLAKYSYQEICQTAELLARIHNSTSRVKVDNLEREEFTRDYNKEFAHIFELIRDKSYKENKYSSELVNLIDSHKKSLFKRIHKFDLLQGQLREKDNRLYITHGDPNWANILIGKNRLHLIDWDTIGLRPVEQDLLFFTGQIEKTFFSKYSQTSRHFKLQPRMIGYYSYIWDFEEILEYSERILQTNKTLEQSKQDLEEVKSYIVSKYDKCELIHRMSLLKQNLE